MYFTVIGGRQDKCVGKIIRRKIIINCDSSQKTTIAELDRLID